MTDSDSSVGDCFPDTRGYEERAFVVHCEGARLPAICSVPALPAARGVLVVVGGPQYRSGSHRQFTLLCRALADQGIPAMRFDYRGMGDAEGDMRSFEAVRSDIRAAVDRFCIELPQLRDVTIWGLCDAASAALFYAPSDARVSGIVLLNPWVRAPETAARTQLRHYYWSRVTSGEFWRKVAAGEFAIGKSVVSLGSTVGAALGLRRGGDITDRATSQTSMPLAERMAQGFARFDGRVLLILSGRDLTANEFLTATSASRKWQKLLSGERVSRRDLPGADHTFSRRAWRDQVAAWTCAWVRSW